MQVNPSSSPPHQVLSLVVPQVTHDLSTEDSMRMKFRIQRKFGKVQMIELLCNYSIVEEYRDANYNIRANKTCLLRAGSVRKWQGKNWNARDTNSDWPTFECNLCTRSYCIRNLRCRREVDISEDWFVLSTMILSGIFDGER